MLRSKDINDYFEVSLSDIPIGVTLTVDLHLFFRTNQHIMIWHRHGDFLRREVFDKYNNKGLKTIWVHSDDKDLFSRFLSRNTHSRTTEGALINEALNSDALSKEDKKIIASETAKKVIRDSLNSDSKGDQAQADKKAQDVVADILNITADKAHSLLEEAWKVAETDPELEHSINVASYGVLFGMAFGRIDKQLLTDIAIAGLMHDIGISQISADIANTPWTKMSPDQMSEYEKHVNAGLELIKKSDDSVSDRVVVLLSQHHEKFDGSGYPNHIKEYDFDDVAQLVSMADIVDTIAKGRFDGVERNLKDSYLLLETLEANKEHPEYFSAELFEYVINWIKSEEAQSSVGDAIHMVEDQMKRVVQHDEESNAS